MSLLNHSLGKVARWCSCIDGILVDGDIRTGNGSSECHEVSATSR
jgi:hypothetical protein